MRIGEDAHHVYVNKPAGLPVFPPHADPSGDCLLARFPPSPHAWPPGFEGGIAHRLDTATSGLMIVARTPEDLARLRAQWGALRKIYVFHGPDVPGEHVVTVPIAHHGRRADRMVVRGRHRGKWYPAWSRFRHLDGPWWEVEIRTGVMHQIRVHAAAIGIPLTGDPIYGGAPGPYVLHARQVIGPGWASPVAPLEGFDGVVRPAPR